MTLTHDKSAPGCTTLASSVAVDCIALNY